MLNGFINQLRTVGVLLNTKCSQPSTLNDVVLLRNICLPGSVPKVVDNCGMFTNVHCHFM